MHPANHLLCVLAVSSVTLVGLVEGQAQGTVVFDACPLWSGIDYSELGLRFQVIVPQGATSHDNLGIVPPNWAQNVPESSNPYMLFFREHPDYVAVTFTIGGAFGLISVQLADPNSPSVSMLPISFVGWKAGGLSVTNTFTTPGNGASTLVNYTFTPAFAFGLTSVDILAPRWAMDNLVYVIPEPSAAALSFIGLLAWAVGKSFTGHQSLSPRTARVCAVRAGKDPAG